MGKAHRGMLAVGASFGLLLGGCTATSATPATSRTPATSERLIATHSTSSTGSTGSTAPEPTGGPTADPHRAVTIGWAGDAVPASRRQGLPRDPAVLLGSVARELRRPDIMVVNLEGTLGNRGLSKCVRWNVRDCHAFQAPGSYAADVFAASGVDVVNTANNHSFDYGEEGQADTRSALSEAGVAATGAAGEVTVVERKGVRVAVIGLAPYGWGADFRDARQVDRLVRQARDTADVVVAVLHSGAEGTGSAHTPDRVEWYLGENRGDSRALARRLIDGGADLVVGSGPHVVRGLEFYRGRLIAYSSLGNLVGYGGAFQTGGDLSLTGILQVELSPDGEYVGARVVPLLIGRDGIPRPDAQAATVHRMNALSRADFGSSAAILDGLGRVQEPRAG